MDTSGLITAVQFGDFRVVKEKIGSRLSPDTVDDDGCSLLHWAAINNRVGISLYLIERGADVNIQGGLLMETPLHWAVRKNFYRICQLLIDHGADMTVRSNTGLDVIHLACQLGNMEMLFLLLSSGANPNSLNDVGDTPLMAVINGKEFNIDMIRLLLRMGADITIQNPSNGNNALHAICQKKNKATVDVAFLIATAPGSETAAEAQNHYNVTPWQVQYQLAMQRKTRCL
jgi:palmitoyltransferase ZDHHC13/17